MLASSQSGLWKSFDGENWALYNPAIDTTFMAQSEIMTDIVYTAVIDDRKEDSPNSWCNSWRAMTGCDPTLEPFSSQPVPPLPLLCRQFAACALV